MANDVGFSIGDEGKKVYLNDVFGDSIRMKVGDFISLSHLEFEALKMWVRDYADGIFAVFWINELIGNYKSSYECFETLKNEVSIKHLLLAISSPYIGDNLKKIIDAVIEGENPYSPPEKEKYKKPFKPGIVYLLHSENGFYKIGRTSDGSSRLSYLTEKLPINIELVHQFRSDTPTKTEKNLHDRFSEKRIKGEWFSLSDEDVSYICSIKDGDM